MNSINSTTISTASLKTHYLAAGDASKSIVVLLHGNVSSSAFFIPFMKSAGNDYYFVAPDMRGYGNSETKGIDATQGVDQLADDLVNFINAINSNNKKVILLGWSLGAAVVMKAAMSATHNIAGLFLLSPMSPFGFGASTNEGLELIASSADFAGSGGGAVNPSFIDSIRTQDEKIASQLPEGLKAAPQNYCRTTMNSLYFHMLDGKTLVQRGVISQETEDAFVESMFLTKLGDANYPGNSIASSNWPSMAPGDKGINNAISAKYCNISNFASLGKKIPIVWLRGDCDLIVSDTSFVDVNNLGKLGYIPGWPGEATNAPQPMVKQMRAVLEAYKSNGGSYEEVVFEACGHSPHIEYPEKFKTLFSAWLAKW